MLQILSLTLILNNKMAKSKKGLGTYSNDGLGNFDIEFSEEDMANLILSIQTNKNKIRIDFTEIISRIDSYLKKYFGAIPNTEDFVIWHFNKQKIKHLGKNKIKVTEEDIFLSCKEYVENLDKIRNGRVADNLKLNYGKKNNDKIVKLLYSKLYPIKIDVSIEEFEQHFDERYNGSQIKWSGTETELVNLFASIKFEDPECLKALSLHFINNKNKKFTAKQLSVSKSKSSDGTKYRGKDFVEEILNEINTIKG